MMTTPANDAAHSRDRFYAAHFVFSALGKRSVILERFVVLRAESYLHAEDAFTALIPTLEAQLFSCSAAPTDRWVFEGIRYVAACDPVGEHGTAFVATKVMFELDEETDVEALLDGEFVRGVIDW